MSGIMGASCPHLLMRTMQHLFITRFFAISNAHRSYATGMLCWCDAPKFSWRLSQQLFELRGIRAESAMGPRSEQRFPQKTHAQPSRTGRHVLFGTWYGVATSRWSLRLYFVVSYQLLLCFTCWLAWCHAVVEFVLVASFGTIGELSRLRSQLQRFTSDTVAATKRGGARRVQLISSYN